MLNHQLQKMNRLSIILSAVGSLYLLPDAGNAEVSILRNPKWTAVPGTSTPSYGDGDSAFVDINSMSRNGDVTTYDLIERNGNYARIEVKCQTKEFRDIRYGYFETNNRVNFSDRSGGNAFTTPENTYQKSIQAFACRIASNIGSKSYPCGNIDPDSSYDKNMPTYHSYSMANRICSQQVKGCTKQRVFAIMLSEDRFITPTTSSDPVQDCKVRTLSLGNPIISSINRNTFSVTNYTQKGHIFYPGRVTRQIISDNGYISVYTVGEGTGDWPWINKNIGADVWNGADSRLSLKVRLILSSEN